MTADDDSEDTRRVMDSLRRLVRHMRTAAAATSSALGVSAAQLFVLKTLETDSDLSVNELAARTFTDQSSVSVVAQRLVDAGLVARRRSEKDGRRVELSLTEAGRTLLASNVRPPSEELLEGIHRLRRGRRRVLARALAELLHEMGIENEPASMLFEDESGVRKSKRAASPES